MRWNIFAKSDVSEQGARRVRLAIPAEHVETITRRFLFAHEWICACGATLRIRSKEDRSTGPSNFVAFPAGHKLAGHSQVPSGGLTWDGMAEERGWQTRGTKCPACLAGLSVADYKQTRRGR